MTAGRTRGKRGTAGGFYCARLLPPAEPEVVVMRDRRHLVVFVITLFVCCLALGNCRKADQPAETNTKGNATDRDAATGTNGTGQPPSASTATTAAAQQLGTVAPSAAVGAPVALTGTEVVHAQRTETTATLQGPGGTTT